MKKETTAAFERFFKELGENEDFTEEERKCLNDAIGAFANEIGETINPIKGYYVPIICFVLDEYSAYLKQQFGNGEVVELLKKMVNRSWITLPSVDRDDGGSQK